MKPINELSADELRREIFEYRGGTGHFDLGDMIYSVYWQGSNWHGRTLDEALDRAGVPNWTSDAGAALALCLDIVRNMGDLYEVIMSPSPMIDPLTYSACIQELGGEPDEDREVYSNAFAEDNTPALALARLALAALRANSAADMP